MSILINQDTEVVVQGITGKEGMRATQSMLDYGTNIVAGVRPGKGGEIVYGVPVFNTVIEAKEKFPNINTSVIYVPPFAFKDAGLEAIENKIKTINSISERVPIKDTAYLLAVAKEQNIRVIGPSSIGYIVPNVAKIGIIGGPLINDIFKSGSVGIISRSGGMTNELAWQICKNGMGQSTVVHVGGDLLMGTTYTDLLEMFEKDEQTKVVVLFGEHGGSYEFEIVDFIKNKKFTKPLVVYIGGKFASILPEGMNIGHAGAIVQRGKGSDEKESSLLSVGALIADDYEQLALIAKQYV